MRIQRIPSRQAHPVPETAARPRGPFPRELYESREIVTDYAPQSDGGGDPVPEEGTAQNGYRAWRWFRCRQCLDAVREDWLDDHECEEVA